MEQFHATLWGTTDIAEPDLGLVFYAKDKADAEKNIKWMNGSCKRGYWWVLDGPAEMKPVSDLL